MQCIDGKYVLDDKLDGETNEIYRGKNIWSKKNVTIKLESQKVKYSHLRYKYEIYPKLHDDIPLFDGFENIKHFNDDEIIFTVIGYIRQSFAKYIPPQITYICLHFYHRPTQTCPYIPIIRWFGKEEDYNILVMDELGPSLSDLFNRCNKKFTLKTILIIADQMLSIIEYFHNKSFILRNIHPTQLHIGCGGRYRTYKIYIIYSKCIKRYYNPNTKKHIEYKEGKSLRSTPRYASINAHLGIEVSRRDDLEIIGYILIYFAFGKLPWQGIRIHGNGGRGQLCDKIAKKKMSIPTQILCKYLPDEFTIYLDYCRALRFHTKPNYQYLKKLFMDLYYRKGYGINHTFDWNNNVKQP